MCLNPKKIIKDGNYKENNYRGIKGQYYCISAYSKCGTCTQCMAEKANNWLVRNYYEAKKWKKIAFITLTYKENPYFLIKKDLQDFIKRLRRNLEYHGCKEKIRYFATGEYGSLKGRPHFHIIIYNFEDVKRYFTQINKKCNVVFESEIIRDAWKKGITSYQEFDINEIKYISLYNSPQDTISKAYKLSLNTAKKMKETLALNEKKSILINKNQMKALENAIEEMEREKKQYKLIKEFNTWSLSIGWDKFYDEYATSQKYVFTEYINDGEYATPSPWVKKLANMGDVQAINEMKKREEEIVQSKTEEDEKIRNLQKVNKKKKREIEEWQQKKDLLEDI